MRILCVDDDEDTHDLLKTLLGVSDLEAVAIHSAAEAFRLVGRERFDLYIVDGQMPGGGGLTFCEDIRKFDKTTPIFIFTGKGYEADREAGMLAGANAYIVKPDIKEVIPTVKRLLEQARAAFGSAFTVRAGGQVYVEALIDDELDLPERLPAKPKSKGIRSSAARKSASKRKKL
jgi:DNA-binding response OmpR family regulator